MRSIAFVLLLLAFGFTAHADLDTTQIVLSVGGFRDVPAPHGVHVTVGNGGVIRVSDRGAEIRVIGRKLGTSEVRVGALTYEIAVISEPTYHLYEKLERTLIGKRGLTLVTEGTSVVVKGRLLRWQDWVDLADAARGGHVSYIFSAQMDSGLQARAAEEFRAILKRASLPEVSLDFRPTAVAQVPSQPSDLQTRMSEVLGAYGFKTEISGGALSLEPLVRVKILIAEVHRDRMLQYGIKWPSEINAQLLPTAGLADEGVSAALQALETSGFAQILASPTLVCRSGKEAKFLAGGEIPIKTASRHTSDVVWKQYGIMLKVKPLADLAGRMSIGIETEVSQLDAKQVDGVPGIATTRIESHFDLKHSRTIAISGLIKRETSQGSEGLPGLGQLPIIGSLFSSKNFRENKTELVVFVTPDIDNVEGE